jgi:hypothetical protein
MPLHVSSITCSPSGGDTQVALGMLSVCYVSWLHKLTLVQPTDEHARGIPSASCLAHPEEEQVMLETSRGINLNKLNKKCITLVSLY